jgi:hypothetical protein
MDNMKGPLVKDFVTTAGDFCQLMEQASKQRTGELFSALQQVLPMIYLKASRLPRPKYCYEEETQKFVKEDDYAKIHDIFQQKIEIYLGITQMSPGTRPNNFEMMSFSIAKNFADIYEELKNFVKLYDVGISQAMNDAVWLCRKSFEQNLGYKLIEGLKSLHQLIYNKGTEGSRALQSDDFNQAEEDEEPWYSDDQEEVYGDDE